MKLLRCNYCGDIFNLKGYLKSCMCGETHGKYLNNLDAVYEGDCVPLGFANSSFGKALLEQPRDGEGMSFTAFVIPMQCGTFKKVERVDRAQA